MPPPVDAAFRQRAADLADADALKVTLFHLTGDPALAALPPGKRMSEAQRAALSAKATAWLERAPAMRPLPEPDLPALRAMMDMAGGVPLSDLEFSARRDLPGFRDFPFMVEWESGAPAIPDDFLVVIAGSGFAGICMAVQLQRLGIPYLVLERRPEPGGVWSINRYPDVRVDTASITYEFPFAREHVWDEYFACGSDVQRYIEAVSRRFGVHANTCFGYDLRRARFDEARCRWRLEVTTPGGERTIEATALVTAGGLFARPHLPDLPGRADFRGTVVHPSGWRRDLDLAGRRVATIGNGSTGVQILASLARQARFVHVFQRTPQWIQPRANYGRKIEPELRWLLQTLPGYAHWWRYVTTSALFDLHGLMTPDPAWQAGGGQVSERNDAYRRELVAYIRRETGDRPDLVSRLIPNYAPMSRRPVIDNGWYRALTRDTVELVTDPIERLTADGILTADGRERPVDTIVAATGYSVADYLWPLRLAGRDGIDLHEHWAAGDGPRAYLGMMVPDFPNLFLLYGPNSQPIAGEASMPVWFSLWSSWVARILMRMIERGARRAEVTAAAHTRYNRELDREAAGLLQLSDLGGREFNYFLNRAHGRLQVSAPWHSIRYHDLCSRVDWADVRLS